MKKINYKKAGVNVKKADHLVQWIKKSQPFKNALGSDYASLWPLSLSGYKEPVLASSTDGVGTKLKLANHFSDWSGLGQDLLAMCLNDLICVGAKPLFFLDYYACGQLDIRQAQSFLKGLQKACGTANCPLVGGETAELAGLYQKKDIDCAGFCVGIVEKSKILSPKLVKLNDDIVAFKSSGFHSNGYSLLRKIYKSPSALKKKQKVLMEPTRLYSFLTPFLDQIPGLRAIAHITGGGLDNLSRILPKHLKADLKAWPVPDCFLELKQKAHLTWKELLQTFNCGLGLALILKDKQKLYNLFPTEPIIELGKVTKRKKSDSAWSLDFKSMTCHNQLVLKKT